MKGGELYDVHETTAPWRFRHRSDSIGIESEERSQH
jgi:hypothetical protein